MIVFKSTESRSGIIYDEAHFRKLGKELAKNQLIILKKNCRMV